MITIAHDHLGNRVHIDGTASSMEYFCPVCGSPLDTKKGNVRRHHFSHKASHRCTDSWHGTYSDSEWHFSWQERYPIGNRERTVTLGGTNHRADVVVGRTVVEFQHSALSAREFNDRNAFYEDLGYKVLWLYDLRDLYTSGSISEGEKPNSFTWDNPRQSFNAYDIETGTADLFFQLKEDDGTDCIVRVRKRCKAGFEAFEIRNWMNSNQFLAYTGMVDGTCEPPCLNPLEPNEDYLRFKERYGISLNAQQERAVQTVDGTMLLLAVPGSGKTTVMIDRIGYLVLERHVAPERVIAISYNKASVNEMHERFARRFGDSERAGRVEFRTINGLCYKICEEWYSQRGSRMPTLIKDSERRRVLRDLYRKLNDDYPSERERTEMENAIGLVKNGKLKETEYAEFDSVIPHFSEIYEAYQDHLGANGLMDFDDQMVHAQDCLSDDPALLARWRARYDYWCVDEAQDTSLIQHQLVYNLVGAAGNLFMVGDEDQSIYGFRGARPTAMLNAKFNYRNPLVLKLERNYRSGKEIVDAARAFVNRCTGRFEKRMTSERGAGSTVHVEEVEDRAAQYDRIHALIRANPKGRTFAVIYRDNEIGVPIIDQLLSEGMPFQLLSKANTFFTSMVVLDIKAFMRLAAIDRHDEGAFKRIWAKCGCHIAREDVGPTIELMQLKRKPIAGALIDHMSADGSPRRASNARRFYALMKKVSQSAPRVAIDQIMDWGYKEWLDNKGIPDHRVDLLRRIAEGEGSISAFLRRLEYLNDICGGKAKHVESDVITLATAHSCKGREFDTVVILDAVDGTFPSSRASLWDRSKDSSNSYQEERRLFYVSMTRARDELVLMRPQDAATPFVDEVIRRPSRDEKTHASNGAGRPRVPNGIQPHGGDSAASSETNRRQSDGAGVGRFASNPPSRYDVSSWRVTEWLNDYQRRVTNGDMDAVVTEDGNDTYTDMVTDLDASVLTETVEHIGKLTEGLSGHTLCIDCSKAQEDGTIVIDDSEAVAVLENSTLVPCLHAIAKLLAMGTEMSVTYYAGHDGTVGRSVKYVDISRGALVLSQERLEVF